jgi:hypothetical protein
VPSPPWSTGWSGPATSAGSPIPAAPGHRPDLAGVFAELGKEMNAFMTRYDEHELAAIADYLTRTIAVLRAQTERLAGEPQVSDE